MGKKRAKWGKKRAKKKGAKNEQIGQKMSNWAKNEQIGQKMSNWAKKRAKKKFLKK